ncbi:MAG: ribbon-helix-helix protein, CopG family [Bacteroidales bacterium]|nr:ribbon-helix-helix protein, CopG family [Bacteroidales bacterium]
MNADEKKEIRFGLVLEKSLMKALDSFRRTFENPPSRSEAIRQIIKARLEKEGIIQK